MKSLSDRIIAELVQFLAFDQGNHGIPKQIHQSGINVLTKIVHIVKIQMFL